MMWPVSDRWGESVRSGFEPLARAEVWRDGAFVEDLQVLGGRVSVTEGSDVRRTLSLQVAAEGWSTADLWDLLSPDDTDVRVWAGQGRVDGDQEYAPLGWFRVTRPTRPSWLDGVTIDADDWASVMRRARFLSPWVTASGADVVGEIEAMAWQVDPSIEVVDQSGLTSPARAASASEERDRWGRMQALARSIGCEVAFDPVRRLVIRPVPEVDTTVDPDWVVDADSETATLLDYEVGGDDPGYNAVVASSSGGGSSTPVTAIAYGPSWRPGVQAPRFYASPLLTTTGQCAAAARSILVRSQRFARTLTPTASPHYALDVGDQVQVRLPDGLVTTRIVTDLSFELGVPSGGMPIGTREAVDVSETLTVGDLS